MPGIKEVSDKDIELAKAYPGSDLEQGDLRKKIVAAYGKAKAKVGGLSGRLKPELNNDGIFLIESSRKAGKTASKNDVFFNLVFDKAGLRIEIRTNGSTYNCGEGTDIPSKVDDQRQLLKDMHKYSTELVSDDEWDKFNENNPTAELKKLYEEQKSTNYTFTSFAKLVGNKDALKLFKEWLKKDSADAAKDLDALIANAKNRPAPKVKQIEDKLKQYNKAKLDDVKKRIKEAEDKL